MDSVRTQKLAAILFDDSRGYSISNAGKAAAGLSNDRSFTYGEVSFETFPDMLAAVLPRKRDIFYDLGSGTGKAIVMAAMLGLYKKCIGIELIPNLHQESERIRARFQKAVAPLMATEEQVPEIEFRQADFLLSDWSDADCVFVQGTCMPNDLLKQLVKKFELLKPGSLVIMATAHLASSEFRLVTSRLIRLGWGDATISYYERL